MNNVSKQLKLIRMTAKLSSFFEILNSVTSLLFIAVTLVSVIKSSFTVKKAFKKI